MAGSMVLGRRDPAEVADAPADKVRLFINEDGQLAAKDENGDVVTPEELIASLEAELATKQDKADAATDAELASAIATFNAATALKQDASTAATDAELAAAISALNAAIAAKQDASAAATDAELAAALVTVNSTIAIGDEAAIESIGRRTLRKLTEGVEDVTILVDGDSTGGWVLKVLDGLAARVPTHTVKYRDLADGASDYNVATVRQVGTGSRTLTLYNASVPSTPANHHMAPYFDTLIASKQPDLILFNHGHNHGSSGVAPEPAWRDGLTIATQAILRACPLAELVLIAQNPRTDANAGVQAQRQFITEEIAQMRGYGFVNVHRLFLDVDPAATSLLADGVHPNATGYTLWANEILRRLNLKGSLPSQQPSSFLIPATNILANGDFAAFAAPPTLTSWTAINATLSKDATNYESPNGYAVKAVVTTPGSEARISQAVSGSAFRRLKGEWATFLARVRIPAGSGGNVGKVVISENDGSHAGQTASDNLQGAGGVGYGQGAYRWAMCSRRIAADCTNATLTIYVTSGTEAAEISVDRAILIPGIWPRDIR